MTPEEMAYILDHSEAHFFVAEDQEQIDKFLEIQDPIAPNPEGHLLGPARNVAVPKPYPDGVQPGAGNGRRAHQSHPQRFDQSIDQGKGEDIALLSYTSGTTGLPKGVIISQSYLLDNAFRTMMANEFKPFSQYLSYISPAWVTEHFFAAIGVILPLTYNFPEEPETILANIRELGAEILVFGPQAVGEPGLDRPGGHARCRACPPGLLPGRHEDRLKAGR